MKSQPNRAFIQSSVVLDYSTFGQIENPHACFIFLHGYQETGERILNKFLSILPEGVIGLAPCGLYPIPMKTENGHRVGYSWYFYNPATDEYFIDMKPSAEAIEKLIIKLGLENTPKIVCGFSQGGYIAPVIAHKLKNVKRVIGMGCQFIGDELSKDFNIKVDIVHGDRDEIVQSKGVKESVENGIKLGFDLRLHQLSESGHRIDDKMLALVSEIFGELK